MENVHVHNSLTKQNAKSLRTLIFVFLGFIICFIDRSAMNIALAYVGKTFTLSPAQLGVVGSAFFFSYSLMQVPGGWLVDRFGTKWMTVVSLCAWSVFTIMTGFAWSFASLIVIRILFGLSESPYPAAAMKAVRLAYPKDQRGQASAVAISANYLGSAVAPFVVAPLIALLTWRGAFHVVGLIGIVYLVCYYFLERPLGKEIVDRETGDTKVKGNFDWRVVSFTFVIFGLNVITKGLDTWMPTYLLQEQHINLKGIAWLVPLPSITAGVGAFIAGFIMAKFFAGRENWLISLCTMLTMLLMYGMFKATTLVGVITFEVLAYFTKSIAFAASYAFVAQLVAKTNYGASIGVVNFGGQVAGFIAPLLIGVVVQATRSYSMAFLVLIGFALLAFVSSLTIRLKANSQKGED